MATRYETAKRIGFQESQPGLLNWFAKEREITIFLDFRTKDVEGEWDGYKEDVPPRIYAADEDGDGNTVWLDKEDVEDHWVIQKVEDESGLSDDRGQASLGWFNDDGVTTRDCLACGDQFPVSDLEDGLCIGDDTNGCYYEENPSELFRQAKRRKEEIRNERRS